MKNRLIKNKRGEDMLVDFWAILVFALIVLLFFILFAANKKEPKIQEIHAQFSQNDANFMLQSFLKSPAIGIDSTKTVFQIIIEDYNTGDYSRSDTLAKNYFSQLKKYGTYPVGAIYLQIDDDSLFFTTIGKIELHEGRGGITDETGKNYYSKCSQVSEAIIPSPGDKKAVIRLDINVYYDSGTCPTTE
ncbi:MAG TPA: hypothetical protein VEC16_01890 [Alphaproteobacteria bacterium]|nr:hypothetical protein [Alphaproteobacteria bacterium]